MDIELVTDPSACMMYIVSPLAGLGGGILWRPPAYSLLLLLLLLSVVIVVVVVPSLQCLDTVGWATGRVSTPACTKFGVGLLMVTTLLELCTSSSSCHHSPLPSSLAPVKLANPDSAGKWPLKRREKEME